MNKLLRCLLCAVSTWSAAPAQAQKDPLVGSWHGALRVGVAKLEVALHISKNGEDYRATFDSVTQGARGIPVGAVEREGAEVTARLPAIRAEYRATLVPATTTSRARLEGTWTQGGRSLDLTLEPGAPPAKRRPQHPSGDVPYAREEVAFGHDPDRSLEDSFRAGPGAPVTLAGTLTLPEGGGPHPVAVMITGSGPQDRDESLLGHKPFLVIADHLTRHGVAVLRFDDRGTAESTGDFATATSADFADDVRAALRYLKTRRDIDPARMGLIGHSEGGAVAPMVAAGPDQDLVRFVVLLAPPAVKLGDVLTRQGELIGIAEGGDPAEVAQNVEMSRRAIEAVVASPDDAEARAAALRAIAEEFLPELSEAAREQVGGSADGIVKVLARVDTPWMRWLLQYDPAPTLGAMRCDVLALFGGKDLQVDPAQNRPALEAALTGRERAAKIVTLAGLNHLFQHSETGRPSEYGDLEETFAPEALQLIHEWIAAAVAR